MAINILDKEDDHRRTKGLRDRIKAGDCLRQIDVIDEVLSTDWQNLSKSQIDALRLRADLQFGRLRKVLPDMKSIEVQGDAEAPVKFVIDTGK